MIKKIRKGFVFTAVISLMVGMAIVRPDFLGLNLINHINQGNSDTRMLMVRLLNYFSGAKMTVFTVDNADSLQDALGSAQGGDTIRLASGDYGKLDLIGVKYNKDVTIVSANENAPAVFSTINLNNTAHIKFDNIHVKFTPDAETLSFSNVVLIFESDHISIVNSILIGGPAVNGVPPETPAGGLDSTGNVLGLPTARGVFVHNSNNVDLSNNDISNFFKGIILTGTANTVIANNNIHDLRTSPIVGADVNDLQILNNTLSTSTPWQFGGQGDHGDYIHLWTQTGQSGPNKNIEIKGNFISEGTGDPLLGIYLDDNNKNIGFQNVTITDNVIFNGHHLAILLENVDDSFVSRNTLLQSSGPPNTTPQIVLTDGSENTTVSHNIIGGKASDNLAPDAENNIVLQSYDANFANYTGNFFFDPFTDRSSLSELQLKPGTIFSGNNIGATHSRYNEAPEKLTALFATSESTDKYNGYIFDASFSAGPQGQVAENEAQYSWDFGDGNTSDSSYVTHQFSRAGEYIVVLTVQRGNEIDTSTRTITIAAPELLTLDFTNTNTSSEEAIYEFVSDDGYYLNQTEGAFTISRHEVLQLFGLEEFRLSFSMKNAEGGLTAGDLMRVHSSWKLSVTEEGRLEFSYVDQNDRTYKVVSKNTDLDKNDWHDVELAFDTNAGTLTFFVDGKNEGSGSIGGALQLMESWGLSVGNPFGAAADVYIGQLEFFKFASGEEPIIMQPEPEQPGAVIVSDQLFLKESINGDKQASEDGIASGSESTKSNDKAKLAIANEYSPPDILVSDYDFIDIGIMASLNHQLPSAETCGLDTYNEPSETSALGSSQVHAKTWLSDYEVAHMDSYNAWEDNFAITTSAAVNGADSWFI